MPRVTRSSKIIDTETINDAEIEKPKKAKGGVGKRQGKRKNSTETVESSTRTSTSSSNSSSPNKIPRSNSLSPIANCLAEKLSIKTPKASKFQSARRALADNSNYRLPGREKQYDELTDFLNNIIETKTSASLYINGPPGKIIINKSKITLHL